MPLRGAEWLCEEEASQREGNTIKSCGIGQAKTEAEARDMALDNAKKEFDKICNASVDCAGHKTIADPRRTSCSLKGNTYTCHRLIAFEISSKLTTGRIAHISMQRALRGSTAGKLAKSRVEDAVKAKKTALEKTQAQLKVNAQEFEAKAYDLSNSAKEAQQNGLKERFEELKLDAKRSQDDLQDMERELTSPILNDIRASV